VSSCPRVNSARPKAASKGFSTPAFQLAGALGERALAVSKDVKAVHRESGQRTEFATARKIVLDSCRIVKPERVELLDALWRTLAEDIVSKDDVPSADNSAMDGFALRVEDTMAARHDKPISLRVGGEIAAGSSQPAAVEPGEAIRIMTGGVMPDGADAVVIVEIVQERDDDVLIFSPAKPGQNVRRKGEDVKRGSLVYKGGEFVGPAELGVLASLGCVQVNVFRKPVAAVLTTGDELVGIGEKLLPGRVRSSNTYTLFGQLEEAGAEPEILGNATDAEEELERMITRGRKADILITSGGISAGKFDLVPKVMGRIGEVHFRGVAMKPGNPMSFGKLGETLWFGLPGNPVASMVCFEQFVRPAILKMSGRPSFFRPEVMVRCGREFKQSAGRVHFMRVTVRKEEEAPFAYPAKEQGSGILTSVSLADGLLVVEAGEGVLPRGTELRMQVLRGDRYLKEMVTRNDSGD